MKRFYYGLLGALCLLLLSCGSEKDATKMILEKYPTALIIQIDRSDSLGYYICQNHAVIYIKVDPLFGPRVLNSMTLNPKSVRCGEE